MRCTLGAPAAAVILSATAAAERPLLIHTTITRPNEVGGMDRLTSSRLLVERGKQATIEIGKLVRYALTPKFLKDGTVRIEVLLISGADVQVVDQS